jgi:hypothetical protein
MSTNPIGCTEWERDYDPVTEQPRTQRLVRVEAPHFVAGFVTDGTVRKAAPILKRLIGESDDTARKVIEHFKWKASVVDEW